MTKNDLLPCPLCGGHATEVWPDGRTYHYIKCDACGCRTATHVAAHGGSARDDWNCRAASADLSEFGVDGDWDAAAHIRLLRANGGPSSGYTADLIERLHAALAATEIASLRRELEEARAKALDEAIALVNAMPAHSYPSIEFAHSARIAAAIRALAAGREG